ncbi:predicted protein [Streptomyces filamentosus NRRL 15998]|uniref:Predicted protein n=1 Tax=Streptomyces filamentosus NRRL 15998 TaxID=457431 RepID=D6AQK0_STRFL|nr:predicted protein [Streptomyces filamentosus NRRL 15998]
MCMKKINEPAGDTGFPVYQCRLPVSRRTNEYCTDLLSRRLKEDRLALATPAARTDRRDRARCASSRSAHRRHGRRQPGRRHHRAPLA